MLPEEKAYIPRNVFAAAIMSSMVSNVTLEDDLSLDEDDSFYCDELGDCAKEESRRRTSILNRSQEILNILESIDAAYEEAKPERKKLGKLYSTMPILQPVRKKSKEGLGEMRNATFGNPAPAPTKRPQPHKPSPFDAIIQSTQNQLMQSYRKDRQEMIERAQCTLNSSTLLASARLNDKWESSPPTPSSRKSSLGGRPAVNQSMPILQPVRKKSTEGLGEMRNATFTTRGPLPSSSKAASAFDAILRGTNISKPKVHQHASLIPSGSQPIAPVNLRRAQSVLGTSSTTTTPAASTSSPLLMKSSLSNDKWESSPKLSSLSNQSMPILKPVRKKSKDRLANKKSSEGTRRMQNATFNNPSPSAIHKPSPFDAIIRNTKKQIVMEQANRRGSLSGAQTKNMFDSIVQSSTKQLLQMDHLPASSSSPNNKSPFDDIVKSNQDQLQQLQLDETVATPRLSNSSRKQAPSRRLSPKRESGNMRSGNMRRVQSVQAAPSKWEAASPTARHKKNAVFKLSKPERKGSKDMMMMMMPPEDRQVFEKLQQARRESLSASAKNVFNAIVQSSADLAMTSSSSSSPFDAIVQSSQNLDIPPPAPLDSPPKSSLRGTTTQLRRALSVPAEVSAANKWISSPIPANKKNAVFESPYIPVRQESGDLSALDDDDDDEEEHQDNAKVFQTLSSQRRLQQNLSKQTFRTASLLEASTLDMLLSKQGRQDTTSRMLLQRNQWLGEDEMNEWITLVFYRIHRSG